MVRHGTVRDHNTGKLLAREENRTEQNRTEQRRSIAH